MKNCGSGSGTETRATRDRLSLLRRSRPPRQNTSSRMKWNSSCRFWGNCAPASLSPPTPTKPPPAICSNAPPKPAAPRPDPGARTTTLPGSRRDVVRPSWPFFAEDERRCFRLNLSVVRAGREDRPASSPQFRRCRTPRGQESSEAHSALNLGQSRPPISSASGGPTAQGLPFTHKWDWTS